MNRLLGSTLIAALLAVPALSVAKPGNNGNGNGNGNRNAAANDHRGNDHNNGVRAGQNRAHVVLRPQGRQAGAVRFSPAAAGAATWNCPPGLMHRDPPCVPPGLARQGVTTEEWTGYSRDEIRVYLEEFDDTVEEVEIIEVPDGTLTEAELIEIFGLEPLPDGEHYAVIDGQVVVLDDEDQLILRRIQSLSTVASVADDLRIAPDVSLTEEELMAIYDLDPLEEGLHYAVVDGQVVSMRDDVYDLLQLLRIANALT